MIGRCSRRNKPLDLQHDESRRSVSRFIDHIWRSHSDEAGAFLSMADIHFGLIITKTDGRTWVTFKGPETISSLTFAPPDSNWLGIVFRPGVHMSSLPPSRLVNRQDLTLPASRKHRFGFGAYSLEVPDFSSAEDLVHRLLRLGLLEYDRLAGEVLARQEIAMSERNIQRRFLHDTGVLPVEAWQIQRARRAVQLLKKGGGIAEVAQQVGYFDQSHMTRSLKRFIGLTPSRISDPKRNEILSFLYEEGQI